MSRRSLVGGLRGREPAREIASSGSSSSVGTRCTQGVYRPGGYIRKSEKIAASIPAVAGNGLPDRRALLGHGVMLAGAVGAGTAGSGR